MISIHLSQAQAYTCDTSMNLFMGCWIALRPCKLRNRAYPPTKIHELFMILKIEEKNHVPLLWVSSFPLEISLLECLGLGASSFDKSCVFLFKQGGECELANFWRCDRPRGAFVYPWSLRSASWRVFLFNKPTCFAP